VGGVGRSWYILGGCAGGAKWRYMAIFGSREARSSDAWLAAWLCMALHGSDRLLAAGSDLLILDLSFSDFQQDQ
jgi:hypothetical protein